MIKEGPKQDLPNNSMLKVGQKKSPESKKTPEQRAMERATEAYMREQRGF